MNRNAVPDKIPPQSLEMEQAVLGSMLIERAAIDKVAGSLQSDDFYRDVHRIIYEAIIALHNRDEPVDILTLQEQLKRQDMLDTVGGAPYLVQLTDAVASAANADFYAKRVEEKAILRRLISASGSIQAMAHGDFEDITDVVDRAEQAVFGVARRRMSSYFTPMRTLIFSVFEQLEHRSEHQTTTSGLPTPFDLLNAKTAGLQDSDLIIIAARPSMGKTSLALSLAQHAAIRCGRPAAVFSLEMSKEQLCMRMICSEARVDAHRLRTGYFDPDQWHRVGAACSSLAEAPIYIDDTPDCSAMEIRGKCRRLLAEQKDIGIIVVDYLQLMRSHKTTENRVQEISEIARSLKNLARELKRPVVALSQLSRAVEQRENKHPLLSDLRESGSIEAEADLVVFIYREAYYRNMKGGPRAGEADDAAEPGHRTEDSMDVAELILAKHRNGPTGTIKVAFHPAYARFDNLETGLDQ